MAFAHALGVLVGASYLAIALLAPLAPEFFPTFFNAQFMGADVASLMPKAPGAEDIAVTFALLSATAWALGYALARLYNIFSNVKR